MSAPVGRVPRPRSPLRRWLVALVWWLLAALAAGWGAPPAAAAPLPAAPAATTADAALRVQLSSVSVTGATPQATVTVTGRVTNATSASLYDVRARLWRSTTGLRTAEAVERALTASATPPGDALSASLGHSFAVTPPTGWLTAGASADFVVSGTLAELGFTADASYWVGADLTAATAVEGAWDASGRARLLATVPGATAPHVVTVVTLDSAPRRLRPNLFADDALAAELAAGGRLRRLLEVAGNPGVTWLVDPALVVEAEDMADGYRVVAGDGSEPGQGAAGAAEWLAAFRGLPTANGYQTLYARPDLVGRSTAASAVVLDWALAATSASDLVLPVVVLAERIDATALPALDRRSLPVLQPTVAPAAAWWSWGGAGVASALTLDDPLASPLLPDGPAARASAALARARAAGLQIRIVRTSDAAAIDAAATPGWCVRGRLADLLDGEPIPVDELPAPPDAPGALTPALLGRLQQLEKSLTAYGAAAPTTGLAEEAPALAAGAASESWLADPAERIAYLTLVEQRSGVAGLSRGVGLTVASTVTLSADNSQFPATVTNTLDDPIVVRVVAESENSARLRVDPSDWATIRPGESYSALLTAVPAGSGIVGVDLHVEARDAVRLSKPVRVSVEATNLGMIGWIIVAVSGAVLVVSTVWRIRQMRRRKGNP